MNQSSQIYVMPNDWKDAFLAKEMEEATSLKLFLKKQRSEKKIYPDSSQVFRAYDEIKPNDVSVIILGQDPYHNGTADGLAFSTTATAIPASLDVVYDEIYKEYGKAFFPEDMPTFSLISWVHQGVMLLNRVLTVEATKAKSHYNQGWESITRKTIETLSRDEIRPKVFMLWGAEAQKLEVLINHEIHLVLKAPHPAAQLYRETALKFTGCGHFKQANEFLRSRGRKEVNWFSALEKQ